MEDDPASSHLFDAILHMNNAFVSMQMAILSNRNLQHLFEPILESITSNIEALNNIEALAADSCGNNEASTQHDEGPQSDATSDIQIQSAISHETQHLDNEDPLLRRNASIDWQEQQDQQQELQQRDQSDESIPATSILASDGNMPIAPQSTTTTGAVATVTSEDRRFLDDSFLSSVAVESSKSSIQVNEDDTLSLHLSSHLPPPESCDVSMSHGSISHASVGFHFHTFHGTDGMSQRSNAAGDAIYDPKPQSGYNIDGIDQDVISCGNSFVSLHPQHACTHSDTDNGNSDHGGSCHGDMDSQNTTESEIEGYVDQNQEQPYQDSFYQDWDIASMVSDVSMLSIGNAVHNVSHVGDVSRTNDDEGIDHNIHGDDGDHAPSDANINQPVKSTHPSSPERRTKGVKSGASARCKLGSLLSSESGTDDYQHLSQDVIISTPRRSRPERAFSVTERKPQPTRPRFQSIQDRFGRSAASSTSQTPLPARSRATGNSFRHHANIIDSDDDDEAAIDFSFVASAQRPSAGAGEPSHGAAPIEPVKFSLDDKDTDNDVNEDNDDHTDGSSSWLVSDSDDDDMLDKPRPRHGTSAKRNATHTPTTRNKVDTSLRPNSRRKLPSSLLGDASIIMSGSDDESDDGFDSTSDRSDESAQQPLDENNDNDNDLQIQHNLSILQKIRSKEKHQQQLVPSLSGKPFAAEREALAMKIYRTINATVYHNALPTDLPLVWLKSLNKTAGRFVEIKQGQVTKSMSIELSTKVLDASEKLCNTLAHEMCHLAASHLDGVNTPPHGRTFFKHAQRMTQTYPSLNITTYHHYEINYKYRYECTGCKRQFGRHSKHRSLDKVVCRSCRSPFTFIGTSGVDGKLSKGRAETPYNKFMKTYGRQIRQAYNLTGSDAKASALTMIAQEYNVFKQISVSEYYVGISQNYIPQ